MPANKQFRNLIGRPELQKSLPQVARGGRVEMGAGENEMSLPGHQLGTAPSHAWLTGAAPCTVGSENRTGE